MKHNRTEHTGSSAAPPSGETAWWQSPVDAAIARLGSSLQGLSAQDAGDRLARHGPNTLAATRRDSALSLLLKQFSSPLVLILLFAAAVSALVSDWTDATIVLVVVLASTLLGFAQEFRAGNAVAKLRAQVTLRARVLRDGVEQLLPASELVPGDIVLLSAGSLVPADAQVIESNDLFVSQAALTGETFPVAKTAEPAEAGAALAARTNAVWMGTSVRSGSARVLVVETGAGTVFGQLSGRLAQAAPETEFERGIQRFGYLLTQVMLAMVLLVLAANILLGKPAIDSLLFALALAVGLAPELLPAIISVTLSHGALRMAGRGVLVRRLEAIENFGSMDVLCTDKTGTLTAGVVRLDAARDADGDADTDVLRLAALNARLQTGIANPLDEAVVEAAERAGIAADATKLGEVPYDFVRKRLSVLVADEDGPLMVTKGALDRVLEACATVHSRDGDSVLDDAAREAVASRLAAWSTDGFRVLGLATRRLPAGTTSCTRDDESSLVFRGFLLFFDPPRPGAAEAVAALAARGVAVKMVTGDNRYVAEHVAAAVGLPPDGTLTGDDIDRLNEEALQQQASRATVFAALDPHQKERVILALKRAGHVVGYLGDGINDAPSLHAADVGISVDTAVDVAREAADFVLLRQDLGVLREGIEQGRVTFANTLKYVLTTTSANFGNMLSMAVASVVLPFLPLLASQILLNNFLSDIPAAGIAGDNVDREDVERPRRWDIGFIRDYMVVFGLVSSVFDLLAFAVLLLVFNAGAATFQTGWFIVSLLTELAVALVVRTQLPFWRSRPGTFLFWSTLAVAALAFAFPWLPLASLFGFVPLPPMLVATLAGLTLLYVLAAEYTKRRFHAHWLATSWTSPGRAA